MLVSLAIVCAIQWHAKAYTADLSANPDEAAHFVTGLMARAYLLEFPWPAPMPFAPSCLKRESSSKTPKTASAGNEDSCHKKAQKAQKNFLCFFVAN